MRLKILYSVVLTLLALALLAQATPTRAQDSEVQLPFQEAMGLVQEAQVVVSKDTTTGDCWTNSKLVKNEIEEILSRNGIKLREKPGFFFNVFTPAVELYVKAKRAAAAQGGGCFGLVGFRVMYSSLMDWGGTDKVPTKYTVHSLAAIPYGLELITGSENLDDEISRAAGKAAAAFANNVVSNRDGEKVKRMLSDIK